MNVRRYAQAVLAACGLFLSASPIADASAVTVDTLWDATHRAPRIVVAQVEKVERVYPPDSPGPDGEPWRIASRAGS